MPDKKRKADEPVNERIRRAAIDEIDEAERESTIRGDVSGDVNEVLARNAKQTHTPPTVQRGGSILSDENVSDSSVVNWSRAFDDLLEALPSSFAEFAPQAAAFRRCFHGELAKSVEKRLNQHLQTLPHDSYQEKQQIASWINATLRGFGLAIRDPKTGRPANMVADIKEAGSDVSRFRLEIRDEHGKKQRTQASRTLLHLELMEDEARQEPILEWSKKVRGGDSSSSGKKKGPQP